MKAKKVELIKTISIVVAFIFLLVILFYGGNKGWFSPKYTKVINNTIIKKLESPKDVFTQCSLSFTPLSIFTGDSITGIIQNGKNTLCNVYANDGVDWYLIYYGVTDNTGRLSSTQELFLEGEFLFRAICGDCVTNDVKIYVNPIPEDYEEDIETFCSNEGYEWSIDKVNYAECNSEAQDTCNIYDQNYEFKYFSTKEWCCYKCTESLPPPPSDYCNDEDGGLKYEISGRCKSSKDGFLRDYGDNCPSYFKLNEVSCINGECAITLYECPSGECLNGACVPLPDSDGDGYSDQEEQQAGTNPNDPNSYPGGLLEQCADICKDNNFAGATYNPGGSDNSCMGYGYDHCFPDFGLQYESSDQINDCCCFNCAGW